MNVNKPSQKDAPCQDLKPNRNEFADLLAPFNQRAQTADESEIVGEEQWNNLRLVVAHDRHRAATQQDDETQDQAQECHRIAE